MAKKAGANRATLAGRAKKPALIAVFPAITPGRTHDRQSTLR
jgi:hypothetical protein